MKFANSYLITVLILLISGCSSGGGSSTPESVIAPCDLIYPINQVVALCGIPIVVQVPAVQCGTVTDWSVSPALPEGLVLDFLDGSISGTAVVAGSDQFYAVTASNEGGSSSFSIQITIGSPSVAPTGLAYPLDLIIVAANVPLEAQVPTVDCGDVTTWEITPSLPAGLVFDVTSGIISGTALDNGYNA
ncbi:MAG: putative Ig domain-containing protein, partial [Planctomycetota bacterium]